MHNSTKRQLMVLFGIDKQTKQLKFKKYDIVQNSDKWQMNGLIRQRWLNWIQSPAEHLQYIAICGQNI